MKQIKLQILTGIFILLGTYGHAVEVSPVNIAPIISYLLSNTTSTLSGLDKIKAYADDPTMPAPTVQDYIDAAVTGVTTENLNDVNEKIASKTSSEVDTIFEIQSVVDSVINNQWDAANWDELIWQ